MASPLRFGILGLGMGVHHGIALRHAKGAQLEAVCDRDPDRLSHAVSTFGVKGYSDWRKLLKDERVDAIAIATESGTHAAYGIAAARAGKHLLIEKPVDITSTRIARLQSVVNETGVRCGCIFQSRVEPVNRALKQSIERGRLGKIIGVHGSLPWLRLDSYYAGEHGRWRGTWKLDGGGSLMNQGIHTLDLMIWFAGPVRSVCSMYGVFNHDIEAEDQAVALLNFENGALGTLYTTTCAVPEGTQRIYMYGTKGSFSRHGGLLESCEMGAPTERRRMMERFGGSRTVDTAGRDPMAVSTEGHTRLFEDLARAVRANRDPLITIKDAKHSVEVAVSIYRAGRTRREVAVRRSQL